MASAKRDHSTTGDALLSREGRLLAGLLVGWRCPCCDVRMNSGDCKKTGLQIDHVVPFAVGGNVIAGNLVPLCGACNASKSDSTDLIDWLERRLVAIGAYKTRRKHCKAEALRLAAELDRIRLELAATLVEAGIH